MSFIKTNDSFTPVGCEVKGQMVEPQKSPLFKNYDVKLRTLSNDEKAFVRNCVDIIYRIVKLYGFEDQFNGECGFKMKGTYDHWIECCSYTDEHPIKFVKYKIAAYYSAVQNQVLPPSIWNTKDMSGYCIDNPKVLIGGRVMKYINLLSRVNKHAFESFFTSILYSKKGMPRPNKDFLRKAEVETFKKLTTPPTVLPPFTIRKWADEEDTKVSSLISKPRMVEEIKRVVAEVFKNKYTDKDRYRLFFPSGSANYINSRSKGGVIGQLFGEYSDLLADLKTDEQLIQLGNEINMDMNENGYETDITTVDMKLLDERFKILYQRICDKALMEELPFAVPLGLPEALKARVITKGPGLLYTALKPLQMFLIRELNQHPTFTLTGQPVDDLTLQDIIGAKLRAGEGFMSVDYSDATNQIESWATNAAMYAISEAVGLTVEEELMSIRSLTGHIMTPPGCNNQGQGQKGSSAMPQLNGQLMGGILSFIILCVINAAVLRTVKEITDDRVYTLKDANIAVNGDDGVMKTTLQGMSNWERIGAFCGLSPSVGKVYFSTTFLNINSTTYNYYPQGWQGYRFQRKNGEYFVRVSHYEHVKYVNMGLMMSMKRSGGVVSSVEADDNGVSFGGRVHNLIDTCPPFLQERVLGQFLHMQRQKANSTKKTILVDLPYFIPENMGGLGLPSVGKFTSSDSDLRFCRMIHENPHKFNMPQKPLETMWKTWEYATKRFPFHQRYLCQKDVVEMKCSDIMSMSDIRAKACIEALFRVRDLSVFLDEMSSDTSVLKYQRKCQKIWRAARLSKIPVPEPYVQNKFPKIYNNNDRPLFPVFRGGQEHIILPNVIEEPFVGLEKHYTRKSGSI